MYIGFHLSTHYAHLIFMKLEFSW